MKNQLTETISRAAIYLRISKEDINKDNDGESASIENQRKLLLDYAKENDITIYREYVDDGFSGTNMERPQLQQMITDIKSKEINLVMVKDVSRLGRDHVGVGHLIERVFPLYGVRFLSVNDHYDSTNEQNIDILPFKHVFHEMYARDISMKIRATFKVKYKSGDFIGNFAPYGYQKDPTNKNHLIIDEESASIVKKIFSLAIGGIGGSAIARQLNNQGILCPILYRHKNHPYLNIDAMTKTKEWTAVGVQKILKNIVYLGHMAQGKTERISCKLKIPVQKPRDQWVVVKNTHEAIIDEQTFKIARQRLQGRVSSRTTGFVNIFSGLAKCADCGKNMSSTGTRKRNSLYNLACGGYKLQGKKSGCTNHFINYDILYHLVLEAIQQQIQLSDTEKQEIIHEMEADSKKQQDNNTRESEVKKLTKEKDKIVKMIQQVYNDYYENKIDEDTKNSLVKRYTENLSRINKRLNAFEMMDIGKEEEIAEYTKFSKLIEQYTDIHELNSNLLFSLIDRIEVSQGTYEMVNGVKTKVQTVKIYFKFLTKATTLQYSA